MRGVEEGSVLLGGNHFLHYRIKSFHPCPPQRTRGEREEREREERANLVQKANSEYICTCQTEKSVTEGEKLHQYVEFKHSFPLDGDKKAASVSRFSRSILALLNTSYSNNRGRSGVEGEEGQEGIHHLVLCVRKREKGGEGEKGRRGTEMETEKGKNVRGPGGQEEKKHFQVKMTPKFDIRAVRAEHQQDGEQRKSSNKKIVNHVEKGSKEGERRRHQS